MTFSYNRDIPDAPNNPSRDQPKMKTNTNSIDDLIDVDHVSFETALGGFHKQVSFNNTNVVGVLPTNPISILYTQSGTASSVADLYYANQNRFFQALPIRAWGFVDGTGTIISSQQLNVSGIIRPVTGQFDVTLQSNAVTGTDFAILASITATGINVVATINYTITGPAAFSLFTRDISGNAINPTSFSFIVIQR